MTSARHLIEVMSQFGGCDQSCDGGAFVSLTDSPFARSILDRQQNRTKPLYTAEQRMRRDA